jgi:hypothetical protein
MCDPRTLTPPTAPRPRWGRLAGGLLAGAAAFAFAEGAVPPGAPRVAAELGLAALALASARRWTRANAVALDLAGWCGCASATVSWRVVGPGAGSVSPGRRRAGEGQRLREPALDLVGPKRPGRSGAQPGHQVLFVDGRAPAAGGDPAVQDHGGDVLGPGADRHEIQIRPPDGTSGAGRPGIVHTGVRGAVGDESARRRAVVPGSPPGAGKEA